MIRILPLGGADEIGASCFYLNIDGTGILLDCGIHPQKTKTDSLPKFKLIQNEPVDFLFISHAHLDHIGALPFLIKKFPHVKVYTTKQTLEIAKLTLHNTVRITNEKLTGTSNELLYDHDDIDLILRSAAEMEYEKAAEFIGLRHSTNESIKVTFLDAGHILGSASILIEYQKRRIFYTGDIKLSPQTIMDRAVLPGKPVDVLITESTYAATNSEKVGTIKSEGDKLIKEANRIIHSGGSVLIPVFSLGKMQELFMYLHSKMKGGKLSEVEIFTGGISRKLAHLYDLNRYLVNRKFDKIKLSEIEQFNYFDVVNPDYYKRHPSIVLASSGMMIENTMSNKLMKYWLHHKSFGIFIVGYMDPSTPGYQIAQSKQGDEIEIGNNRKTKVKCSVNRFHFPSHSTREELLEIAEKLKPSRVILIHGESEGKDWLGHQILKSNPNIKVHSASVGNSITLYEDN